MSRFYLREGECFFKKNRLLNKTVNEMNMRACEHETKICAKIN